MDNPFDSHPDDDILEQYSLARLDRADQARVEEHLLICEICRQKLQGVDEFVRAVQAAARGLTQEPLDFTHHTEDGPVRLLVEESAEGGWVARLSGHDLGATWRFQTVGEANEYLLEAFAAMFPRHRCTERCG